MMSVDKTSTSKTEQSKQERLGEAIGLPSVDDYTKTEEQVNECRQYTVEDLFCCAYAPFFWQAIQIRYPEYATYNRELYALFGGAD